VVSEVPSLREPGKFVEELPPSLAQDKGGVLRRLVADTAVSPVASAGDDLGDCRLLMPSLLWADTHWSSSTVTRRRRPWPRPQRS
jgi:hypothetical protein